MRNDLHPGRRRRGRRRQRLGHRDGARDDRCVFGRGWRRSRRRCSWGSRTAGAADGSSCANARSAAYFNTASNWGSAKTFAPGVTVGLCGTISSTLTAQGSGTSGNPITLVFQSGAKVGRRPGPRSVPEPRQPELHRRRRQQHRPGRLERERDVAGKSRALDGHHRGSVHQLRDQESDHRPGVSDRCGRRFVHLRKWMCGRQLGVKCCVIRCKLEDLRQHDA